VLSGAISCRVFVVYFICNQTLNIFHTLEAIDVLKKYNARPDSTKNLQGRVMSFLMDVKKMHPQLLQEAAQTVMDKGYLSQMSPVVANVFVDNALERYGRHGGRFQL